MKRFFLERSWRLAKKFGERFRFDFGRRRLSFWRIPFLTAVVFLAGFGPLPPLKSVVVLSDGKSVSFETRERFVGEALRSAGITFGEDDVVLPPAGSVLVPGEVVTVRRTSESLVVRRELVPNKTIVIPNKALKEGKEVELRAGHPGLVRKTVRRIISNNTVKEEVLAEDTLLSPVDRKVFRGTRGTESRPRILTLLATAYTPGRESCGKYADGKTAVMSRAGYGIVAVDPKVIPLGTRLYVEGYGFALAQDVGGRIRGRRIDLLIPDLKTARRFGARKVKVYVLD